MITILFYKDDKVVRSEVCHNEFEADLIVDSEKHKYTSIEFVYGKKDDDAV
jgi:hypothetical protein